MLVITRRDGEFINLYVEGKLLLRLTPTQDGYCQTRIAIEAPPFVKIMRAEIGPYAEPVTAQQLADAQVRAELARAGQTNQGKE